MDVDSLKSMASIEVVGTNGTAVDGVWAVATSGEKIGLIAVIVDTCPITKKEVGVYNYHIGHISLKISKKNHQKSRILREFCKLALMK